MKKTVVGILFFIAVCSISVNGFSDLRMQRGPARKSTSPTTHGQVGQMQRTSQQSSGQSSSGEQAFTCRISSTSFNIPRPANIGYHFSLDANGHPINHEAVIYLTCNEDRQGGRTNAPDRMAFQSITEAIRFHEFALNKTIYLRVRFHNNLPHSSYYVGE